MWTCKGQKSFRSSRSVGVLGTEPTQVLWMSKFSMSQSHQQPFSQLFFFLNMEHFTNLRVNLAQGPCSSSLCCSNFSTCAAEAATFSQLLKQSHGVQADLNLLFSQERILCLPCFYLHSVSHHTPTLGWAMQGIHCCPSPWQISVQRWGGVGGWLHLGKKGAGQVVCNRKVFYFSSLTLVA